MVSNWYTTFPSNGLRIDDRVKSNSLTRFESNSPTRLTNSPANNNSVSKLSQVHPHDPALGRGGALYIQILSHMHYPLKPWDPTMDNKKHLNTKSYQMLVVGVCWGCSEMLFEDCLLRPSYIPTIQFNTVLMSQCYSEHMDNRQD